MLASEVGGKKEMLAESCNARLMTIIQTRGVFTILLGILKILRKKALLTFETNKEAICEA